MRVEGLIAKKTEMNKVKVFNDDNQEIIGVARLVIHTADKRQVIMTLNTLGAMIELNEKAVYIRGEKYKLEKHGKGLAVVRDDKTGKLILEKFDGVADVLVKKEQ